MFVGEYFSMYFSIRFKHLVENNTERLREPLKDNATKLQILWLYTLSTYYILHSVGTQVG